MPSSSSETPGLLLVGEEALLQRRGEHAAEVADQDASHAAAGGSLRSHQLVGADALAALQPPAEDGRVHLEPLELERRAGDHRARSRGAGSPRRAATARGPRCAGGPRRRRRSRCARPPPSSTRVVLEQPRGDLLVAVAHGAARAAREREQRVLLVHERRDAAQRVELLPARRHVASRRPCPRQSTWRPAASPRTRTTRALHAARDPPRRHRLELERRACRPARRASPPRVCSIDGPSGSATGLRPSNRIVAPDRAVPWMSCAGSKKDSASAGALTARAPAGPLVVLAGGALHVVVAAGVRARRPPATRSSAHAGAPACAATTRARGREQQQQADDVGEEARRDQERAAEDHEHAVDHLAVRHPALRQGLVEAPPDRPALGAEQQRAEHRIGRQQQDRPHRRRSRRRPSGSRTAPRAGRR